MNESKRLIRNTFIISIGNLSTKLISFFLLPLYTSLLTTSEYGTFDYIGSIAVFCVPLASVLMDESIFRFLIDCKNEQESKTVISTSVFVVLLGLAGFALVGAPVMCALRYRYSLFLLLYVVLNVLCGMLSALLRGLGRIDRFTLYNFILGVTQIVLNVLFIAVFRMGLRGMLLATILSLSSVSIVFILCLRIWRYISFRSVDLKTAKSMVTYSLPLIPNKISWTVINLSDRIVLTHFIGQDATGIYAVAHKFPTLMDTVYGFFYQSWKESSARVLGDGSQNDFYNMVYRHLKRFLFSLVLGMTAFMPLVFRLMINESFHDALNYVPILLLATYFANISGFYGGIFTAYKDTRIMGTTTIVAAVINLVLAIAAIKYLGMYSAACSTLAANLVVCLYRWSKVRKYVRLQESPAGYILTAAATAAVLFLFYTGSTLCMIISCAVAVIFALAANRSLLGIIFRRIKNNRSSSARNEG